MIAQIKESVVEKKQWLTSDELTQVIAIAESTPGPIAINLATYVGYKRKGFWGSVFATLGVVLPSMVILFLLSLFLRDFTKYTPVQYAFTGINCAVAFLILKTGAEMFLKMEKSVLTVLSFLAVFTFMIVFEIFSIPFRSVFYILIGGGIGVIAHALTRAHAKKTENENPNEGGESER